TTASTSTSTTVAQAAEVAVGAFSAIGTSGGVPSFSGLTSTYAQRDATRTSTGGASSTQNTTETYDLEFTGALPAIGASLTISSSVDWAGVIVTFKSKAMHWIASSAGIFSANGNWSWSKGGTSNGSNPGTNDDVIFDNGGLGNATTTSAVT